jgi:hypothetical protein
MSEEKEFKVGDSVKLNEFIDIYTLSPQYKGYGTPTHFEGEVKIDSIGEKGHAPYIRIDCNDSHYFPHELLLKGVDYDA